MANLLHYYTAQVLIYWTHSQVGVLFKLYFLKPQVLIERGSLIFSRARSIIKRRWYLLDSCQLENSKRVTTFTSWLICRQAVEAGQLAAVAAAEAAQWGCIFFGWPSQSRATVPPRRCHFHRWRRAAVVIQWVPCQLCLGIKCDLCLCGIRLLMPGSSINNFSEASSSRGRGGGSGSGGGSSISLSFRSQITSRAYPDIRQNGAQGRRMAWKSGWGKIVVDDHFQIELTYAINSNTPTEYAAQADLVVA